MATLNTTKTALARKLGVSRGSLYYKPKKPPLDLEDKNKIVAVMEELASKLWLTPSATVNVNRFVAVLS